MASHQVSEVQETLMNGGAIDVQLQRPPRFRQGMRHLDVVAALRRLSGQRRGI